MHDQRPPRAAGSLLAACIIAGAVAGILAGEPSIGFLAGTGVGTAIALFVWWRDR